MLEESDLPMLCLILIVGGLLIMMGQHDRSEALFYYFRLEDQVPETHLLRLIEKHISFAFVRERLKQSYSETGRPSIDPELLLRILLIGYLYGITSERKLRESQNVWMKKRSITLLAARTANISKGLVGSAIREIRECATGLRLESTGDGKGTNYNLAKVKTGFGINSS
jgi:transposase